MFIKLFQIILVFIFLKPCPALADTTIYENGVVRPENRMEEIPIGAETQMEQTTEQPAQNVIREYKAPKIRLTSPQKTKAQPAINYKSPSINYNDRGENRVIEKPFESVNASQLSEHPKIKEDCDSNNYICIITSTFKNYTLLEAKNKSVSARTVNINYILNNMRTELDSQNKNIILKPSESKIFDRLTPLDPTRTYGYNYNYKSYFGVIDAVADDYEYDLPYDIDKNPIVLQAAGGKFTHSGDDVYYSYDFKMPIGTPVLAARDGIVVKIIDNFSEGGTSTAFKNRENYIYIQHSDGTIANYAHLKFRGAATTIGAYVQKGDKIGYSGNTGYTTDPHLHFGVFKVVKGGKNKSVPIKFKTSAGVVNELKAGEFYKK